MKRRSRLSLVLVGALTFACAPAGGGTETPPELEKFAVDALPRELDHKTLVDFGGKVHLVGWELSPMGRAMPGSKLDLTLYWRSMKRLDPGFHLYTHLTAPDGTLYEFDDVGPLRESVSDREIGKRPRFPPSVWSTGTIYVDEQSLEVPRDVTAAVLTLSVGVKHAAEGGIQGAEPGYKLEVLTGVSDGREGALLGRLATGVRRGEKARKEPRRRPGMDRRGTPPAGPGSAARPRGLDAKENPP